MARTWTLAALILALGFSGSLSLPGASTALQLLQLDTDGRTDSLSVDLHAIAVDLPACRRLALGAGGAVLLAGEEGNLLLVDAEGTRSLEGSLPTGSWPEAVDSDGADWWILHRQGREILRLGRRGELLGTLRTPEGFWSRMDLSPSGRIWLSDSQGERFVALGRGGQLLLDWNPASRIPGYRAISPLWCADESGGLVLLGGRKVYRLNAAGNLQDRWTLPESCRPVRLLSPGSGAVLVLDESQGFRDLAFRRDQGLHLLGGSGRELFAGRISPASQP